MNEKEKKKKRKKNWGKFKLKVMLINGFK